MLRYIRGPLTALLAFLLAFIVGTLACAAYDSHQFPPEPVEQQQTSVITLLTHPDIKAAQRVLMKRLPADTALDYAHLIYGAAWNHGVSGHEAVLAAQVMVESRGRHAAVGPRTRWGRALGLGQIMPAIWRRQCPGNLLDPQINLDCQGRVFSYYLTTCEGDVTCALNGYWGWRGDRYNHTRYTKEIGTWME